MNMNLKSGIVHAKKRVDALIEHMAQNGMKGGRAEGVWDVREQDSIRLSNNGENNQRLTQYAATLYCTMFGAATFYEWAEPSIGTLLQKISVSVDSWEKQVYARWPRQEDLIA